MNSTTPHSQAGGPCWATNVRDYTGEVVPGASAEMCFASFNAADLFRQPSSIRVTTTITLPDRDSFTTVNMVSVSPLQDLNAVPSKFTHMTGMKLQFASVDSLTKFS